MGHSYFRYETPPEEPVNLPETTGDESCAICGGRPRWLHPLRYSKIHYRAWDQGYSLPHYWFLCGVCEGLYTEGDSEALVQRWFDDKRDFVHDRHEDIEKPLSVFREADLGGRTVPDA